MLFTALLAQASSQKCYALAMEGGGMKGAYEAGALKALTEFLPPEETSYSIITGISIGAVNGCMGVGFPVGQEKQMAEHIYRFWNEFYGEKELVTQYFGGPYFAFFFRNSLYNNANELKTIKKWTGDTIRRNLTVSATSYDTGVFTNFTQDIGIDLLTQACFASSAFPIALTPVELNGTWWGDGAMISNINGRVAIEKCRELGYDDQDIVIDYLFDETVKFAPERVNKTKHVLERLVVVKGNSLGYMRMMQDLKSSLNVTLRYLIIPSVETYDFADTKPEDIQSDLKLGYNDARKLINMTQDERMKFYYSQIGTVDHYLF